MDNIHGNTTCLDFCPYIQHLAWWFALLKCNSLSEKPPPEGNKHMTAAIYLHTYTRATVSKRNSKAFIKRRMKTLTEAPEPGAECRQFLRASSAPSKMSEAYIAGRVRGDKHTRAKMSECHPLPWQPAKFGKDFSVPAKGQIICYS